MKRYFISADIEGVTDVTTWKETEQGDPEYERARVQMSKEVAAACRAILDSGAEPVVRDGHDSACNIFHELLPKGTTLHRGWASDPATMMAGVDQSFDGALYIGYHAPGGSAGSPLAHTISNTKYSWFKVNGKLASELTFNSLYAAERGVPSLFLSGDAWICSAAESENPGMVTVPVKTCVGGSTYSIHPEEACDRIYNGVKEALQREIPVRAVPEVLDVEIRMNSHMMADGAAHIPGAVRIDANTVRLTAESIVDLTLKRWTMQG